MKTVILVGCLLLTGTFSAQTYTMPAIDASVTTCSGTFYDNGGAGGNYGGLWDADYTITPTAGNRVRLAFTAFQLENNFDFLYIYDGTSISAPLIGVYTGTVSPGTVTASQSNLSGALTVRFRSDLTTNLAGWTATISCLPLCQTITANFVSSNPAPNGSGIVRLCQNQNVNFVGSGTFSTSGTGATYLWSFGDGTTAAGTSVNKTYAAGGIYVANLRITDPNGCINNNNLNRVVQVSTTPTINTSATPATLCTNQFSALNAVITMNGVVYNCSPPVSGTTFLPDNSAGVYQTSITVNCYAPGAAIAAATDFQNVCLNIEHSYLGDLNMRFICPNGQSMVLKSYPGGAGTYLGAPIDDLVSGPGTGRQYCFTPAATTLLTAGTTSPAGTPSGNSIVAGNYRPVNPFTNLVGCPLNGNWTIEITDNLASDDGYIFNWDVNFTVAQPAAYSFTPTIASQGWVPNPAVYQVNATQANALPTTMGTHCYNYSLTDNFGCPYTVSQCINVNCTSLPVGLVSFDAKPVEHTRVELSWITESEEDNDRFEVDRSVDGEIWEKIAVLNGAGDSQEELHYFTVDPTPYRGISYYRLRQIDTDGTERISDIDVVNLSADGLVIYPNPANDYLVVEGNLQELETFQLLDASGRDVRPQIAVSEVHDSKLELNVSELAKGTYMVRTTTAAYLVVIQ